MSLAIRINDNSSIVISLSSEIMMRRAWGNYAEITNVKQ